MWELRGLGVLRSCGREVTAKPATMGRPEGGMEPPQVSGCDMETVWCCLPGPGGSVLQGRGFREDESLVGAARWRRVLCASQCVLKVAGGTRGLVAHLSFGASPKG